MTHPPLRRDTADQMLAGLGAAHDRIAAAMFAIDGHAGLALLRAGGLSGQTAARWAAVRPEVDLLWAQFALLGELLDQARALRDQPGEGAWRDLSALLTQPVVGADASGLPVLAMASGTQRLAGFTDQLERRGAAVLGHLAEVDAACSALGAQLVPLTIAADALLAPAAALGGTELAKPVRDKATAAAYELLADPLAAAPQARLSAAVAQRIAVLRKEVDVTKAKLDEIATLRDGLARRSAALDAALDGLAAGERTAADACAVCAEKIAAPNLPLVPAAEPVLRPRLATLLGKGGTGRWVAFAADVASFEQTVREATQRASEVAGLANGLVARRDELRGRLDAYRAKAAALRLVEDERLAAAYRAAHDLLYMQPCDLRASTRAVHAYQVILAELQGAAREPRES